MSQLATSAVRILVVDDDRTFRLSTAALLEADGYEVDTASSGQAAVVALRDSHFDAMLLDVKMPGTDGIAVVEALRLWGNGIPVLMISGVGTVNDAVRALHAGADDFLTKPVEPDTLSARLGSLLDRRPSGSGEISSYPGGMIGRSPPMLALFDDLAKVAPTESTVLITGETGTGKELAARAVHDQSRRRHGPFVAIDCGALPEGLLESELFGHLRGAFSGAVRDKAGLFETASGGTIFLDEVCGISAALQQRLLRVLQERETTRVGATRATKVNVRILAATNRDLRTEVQENRFREDLFYRLNVFPLYLPPLRERAGDVPVLVEHALRILNRDSACALSCSPFAMRLLRAHHWPGNVRELISVVESASIRAASGTIGAQHLPPEVRGVYADRANPTRASSRRYNADTARSEERDLILEVLSQTGGALAKSADLLGMGRTTLWRKIKEYQICTDQIG